MNWIQVVYFKLKEIWPLLSNAQAKKPSSFLLPFCQIFEWKHESMKPNLSQKVTQSTTLLRNWVQVVYFKLKEIRPLFSTAKDKRMGPFFWMKVNLSQNLAFKLGPNDNTEELELESHVLNSSCLLQTERDMTSIFPC